MSSTPAGHGEWFEERFDLDSLDVIREGEHAGYNYIIIQRYTRDKRNRRVKSHYTVYVQIPEEKSCNCRHILSNRHLPHSPGHHGKNFGPTKDNWIGFGTLDNRDFNYTSKMEPFKGDNRMNDDDPFSDRESPSYFTPQTLVDSTIYWINDIDEHLGNSVCPSCATR